VTIFGGRAELRADWPDASVFIAHLNPADPHHQAATEVLPAGTPGRTLVHTIALADVLVGAAA
jgi:predicted nucleic acid-binding protein